MTAEKNSDYHFSMVEEEAKTRIVAMGIGGMGRNAMENLASTVIEGLELYSVNTDMQALEKCVGSNPVQIGAARTAGKGAGGNSEVGKLSAEDDAAILRSIVEGAELVFIAAGMGGGTGTGAAPVIAAMCREMGILTVGCVTTPMECEGRKRMEKARQGLTELRAQVDSLLVIENEKLSLIMDEDDVSIIEVFRRADNVLVNGVAAISGMINSHGYINLDLADLRNVLKRPSEKDCADALIAVGIAEGENRALKAAAFAMENPLLANGDIKGANNLLINVSANENMGLTEAHSVVQSIADQAGDSDREIFMGIVTDNSLGERISVTLIATGSRETKQEKNKRPEIIQGNRIVETEVEKIGRKIYLQTSQAVDEVLCRLNSPANHQKKPFGTENVENFGFSPMVKKEEWRSPAYARRECLYNDLEFSVAVNSAVQNDFREEVSALRRTRGKNRRIYREQALRLAC